MKTRLFLTFCSILLLVPGFGTEKLEGDISVKGQVGAPTIAYYEIEGKSAEEIRNQLNKHGPPDSNGITHDALTLWGVRWNLPGYGTATGQVTHAEVTSRILIVLPRLKNAEDLPKELKERWEQYEHALLQHEWKHAQIAQACRTAVEKGIRKSDPKEAEAVAAAILRKHKEDEIAMDVKTDHGKKDGAIFP